ncbi:MAG: choice-of-anchor D domain-containing protein [Myxococcota bacterium]
MSHRWIWAGLLLTPAALGCSDEAVSSVRAAIHVNPESIELGDTPIGLLKKHPVEIVSLGSAPLTVQSITLGPAVGSATISQDLALNVTDTLPLVVATSAMMSFEVQHIPRDAILDSGALHIKSDDPSQPEVIVPITQTGVGAPKIAAVPDVDAADVEAGTPGGVRTFLDSIHFGQVNVGLRKQEVAFVVNVGGGNLPLEVKAIHIVEPNLPNLTVSATPDPASGSLLLPPLSAKGVRSGTVRSIEVDVSWRPSMAGESLAATLRIESNDPRTPALDIPITGSTDMVDPPLMRVVPTDLDFGSVTTGMSSEKTFTVYNDGGSVLPLEPLTITGTPAFQLVDAPMSFQISPGQSHTFSVRFAPSQAVASAGAVHVVAAGLNNVDVNLHGLGSTVMMCTPVHPDPGEPQNNSCASGIDRGMLALGLNQQEMATVSDASFDAAMDQDWNRWSLAVDAGCDLVGYALTARVTLPAGEQGEVCLSVGDCASPDRTRCAPAGSTATIYIFPADDLCNTFNNLLPVNVEVHHTGGMLSCQPYSVSFTAR